MNQPPKRSKTNAEKYKRQFPRTHAKRVASLKKHIERQPQDAPARAALMALQRASPLESVRGVCKNAGQ